MSATEGYDPAFFDPLAAAEDAHFWFRARNEVIAGVVRRLIADLPKGYRVLEVGCGTGNVLRVLEKVCMDGVVVGMDLYAEGLRHARRRVACPLVRGDVYRPPFREGFDLIGLFDVLEHIGDDRGVLDSLVGLLRPGGRLILTVPAHQSLWSYFDEASCHARRYEPEELAGKLADAGLHVDYSTLYMASLFPLVWFGRRIAPLLRRRISKGKDAQQLARQELRIVPVFNDVLTWLLHKETKLVAARRRLPVGTSLLAVARNQAA